MYNTKRKLLNNMKIKKNDKVKLIAGKDKGKTGKVIQVIISDQKVVVEGLNLMIKHQRPKKQGEKGQRIQFPSPIDISSVALVCPKCNKITRVGFQISKSTKTESDQKIKTIKNRICKKC